MINRKKIFGVIRKINGGKIDQAQVDAWNFIFDKLDADDDFQALSPAVRAKYFAYILVTIWWETAHTARPIKERGGESYLRRKKYYPYYGRGYVQLTWDFNYDKFGLFLGIDLKNHPEYAYDRENAWAILKEGMTDKDKGFDDPEFTAFSLEDFFTETKTDFVGARKIINGSDKARTIAGYAEQLYAGIEFVEVSEPAAQAEAIEGENIEVNPEPYPAEMTEEGKV